MCFPDFDFAHSDPAVACVVYTAAWAAVSAAILWPFSRERFLDRSPIILTLVTGLLLNAIEVLPVALPRFFEFFINHSIYSEVSIRQVHNTLVSMTWVERWQELAGQTFLWVSAAGAFWAAINLCRRRAWITNTLAVAYWIVAWFVARAFVA